MKAQDLAILIAEIKNGGPSPVVADQPQPMAALFGDETEMTAGKVMTFVFGEEAFATLVVTAYRRLLLLRKGGKDLCYSSWHKIDFGNWRWQEPDGFLVAGIETTFPELSDQITKNGPPASWQVYFVSPTGERRLLEEVTVHLSMYHYHQQNRYVLWKEKISPTGKLEHEQFAFVFFGYKILLDKQTPGIVDLEALWRMHTDPMAATRQAGGFIPEASPFHPSKAKRTTKVTASRVSKGTSSGRIARKVLKIAIGTGSSVKGAIETAQKVAGLVNSFNPSAAGPGKVIGQVGDKLPPVSLCARCGSPLGSGALFCGKCGYRFGEAVVEEAKDQVEGKVEDAVVEKIEEMLDPGDQVERKQSRSQKGKPASTPKGTQQQIADAQCPHCGTPVRLGWKFCPECARQLPLVCRNCSKEVQPDWKFCPECVHPLPPVCPRCGEEVQPDWTVCPQCTTRLRS
ncbi:MAG: zinc ribbon domain-containing protein [Anaerolineaceae bacterium]|nr:MAG: zinc ribbon domain-containing protein [Anaerolineaceae bacterium]